MIWISSKLLRMNLEPDGYAVRTASDGKQAVETATLDPPDLILLDVMMPHKDGFQVIEELKNIEEDKDRSCHSAHCTRTNGRQSSGA